MCIVPPSPRIASAYAVHFGRYGDVTRLAHQRGVCRQWLYREAAQVVTALDSSALRQEIQRLRHRVQELERHTQALEQRLQQAVVLNADKQAEFASVGQARGVSLPDLAALLEVLVPGQVASVATLGRWTQAAGRQAGALLAVLDQWTYPHVTQAVADEIYVRQPVRMVIEPESLCWIWGQQTERLDGEGWAQAFACLPNLEQVTRDAGSCLGKGVADLNQQRSQQRQSVVADQLDHFHVLREGGRGVGRAERAAQRAQQALVAAEAEVSRRRRASRKGQSVGGSLSRLRACQTRAARALTAWVEEDRLWGAAKAAVQLFTPEGTLNTRARAEAILAEVLPQLPDASFGTAKRLLQRPQTLTYLDEVQRKLDTLPVTAELREAVLRQEGLRRHPQLLQGDTRQAAALRGIALIGALILAKAGVAGEQAVQSVRAVLRNTWRASSLVECVNSVLRMQQARHRKLSQGLLDLKRLYWNSHRFRTGRRRKQTPYQRLGVPWPEHTRWWELLLWTPERLRQELSTPRKAA
jgi:hypothetical protein